MSGIILKKNNPLIKKKDKIHIETTRFDLIKSQFRLKGDPFDYKGKDYLEAVIDNDPAKMVFKTCRQAEKSTNLSNRIGSNMVKNSKYRVTYIAPVWKQAKTFSKDRMIPLFTSSPFLKENYASGKLCSLAVENIVLNNYSTLYIRSTFGSGADSIRGLSNDELYYDEIQDILWDDVPVINECLSHSEYINEYGGRGRIVYAGTPKTYDNTIEYLWQASTQNILGVKCDCGKWIIGGNFENISDEGFRCHHCGRILDVRGLKKEWIRTYEKHPKNHPIEGFHLSQLMMPWIAWSEIINKFKGKDAYPTHRFINEVMGYSYDNSSKVFTMTDFKEKYIVKREGIDSFGDAQSLFGNRAPTLYAGLDWGTGGLSKTTLTIWVMTEGRFVPIFMKKFLGGEAEGSYPTDFVTRLMSENPNMKIGLDYGAGFFENGRIMEAFGHDRVKVYYHSGSQKKILQFSHATKFFTTNRTEVMTKFFTEIKNRGVMFYGNYDMYMDFIPDFLAINLEYNTALRKYMYTHSPSNPDDTVHSSLYAYLTCKMDLGEIEPVFVSREEN